MLQYHSENELFRSLFLDMYYVHKLENSVLLKNTKVYKVEWREYRILFFTHKLKVSHQQKFGVTCQTLGILLNQYDFIEE